MSNRYIEAVLFDLDGVLIDSEGAYTEFWAGIDSLYPTGVENFPLVIKGTTLPDILNRYFAPSLHDDIIQRGRNYEATMKFPIFPGAEQCVRKIKSRGIPCAVVTSSLADKMERLCKYYPEFFGLFDTVLTGNDVKKSKPDPEGYIKTAQSLGADPAHCLVVEDSCQGMQAGKAAGATVAGITRTVGREATSLEADIVIDSIAELDIDNILPGKETGQ